MSMDKKTYIFLKVVALLFCTMIFSTCKTFIEEDMSDCPEEIHVYFDVEPYNIFGDMDTDELDRMSLFVFDDKGVYLREYVDNDIDAFNENYYIDCSNLLPGNYSFIAWGGKHEDYEIKIVQKQLQKLDEEEEEEDDEEEDEEEPIIFIKGKTTFDEALLMLNHTEGIVSMPVPHIFHSYMSIKIDRSKIQRIDMPLMQLSNTINILLKGLQSNASDVHTVNITDNNNVYHFDGDFANEPDDDDTFKYTQTFEITSEGYGASLTVMRLAEERTPKLQISNQSANILFPSNALSIPDNLVDMINLRYPQSEYPDFDFDKKNRYDIVITFETIEEEEVISKIEIDGESIFSTSHPEIHVYFDISNSGGTPIAPDIIADIGNMYLYVFDENDKFISEYPVINGITFNSSNISNQYIVCSDLPLGNYRFIAWNKKDEDNYHTETLEPGVTTVEQARLILQPANNIVNMPLRHLFHSDKEVTIASDTENIYMQLIQFSNTINISITGLPNNILPYTVKVNDENRAYNFTGSIATHASTEYNATTNTVNIDATSRTAELTVLRLTTNSTTQLEIYNDAGALIFTTENAELVSLIDMIQKSNPSVNFDTQNVYNIEIDFEGEETNLKIRQISIGGWVYTFDEYELF